MADDLKVRALQAEQARLCCRGQSARIQRDFLTALGDLQGILMAGQAEPGDSLAFVPGTPTVVPQPPARPVTRVPPAVRLIRGAGPVIPGAIILAGYSVLSSLQGQIATLTAVALTLEIARKTAEDTEQDCEDCIRQHMWSQSRPQVRESGTIRRRV